MPGATHPRTKTLSDWDSKRELVVLGTTGPSSNRNRNATATNGKAARRQPERSTCPRLQSRKSTKNRRQRKGGGPSNVGMLGASCVEREGEGGGTFIVAGVVGDNMAAVGSTHTHTHTHTQRRPPGFAAAVVHAL